MSELYLLDSDFLIEHLRGMAAARAFFGQLDGDLCVSVISVAELYSGVRSPGHQAAIEKLLQLVTVISIDAPIAIQAGLLRAKYRSTHGTSTPDALIAATAERLRATLVSFNQRHFPMVTKLIVPYTR